MKRFESDFLFVFLQKVQVKELEYGVFFWNENQNSREYN